MQQEMKYIYQVYLDGSFSKAAEHLYITQPALSIAIQKVENTIGMPLFDRSTRPITLTPAGGIYIDAIKRTLFMEMEMEQQLTDIRELNSGRIRLGGSHYINAYILPDILSAFSRKYPGIQIEMHEGSSSRMAQYLTERKVDLTLNCSPELLQNFERYPAFYDHILLAIPMSFSINHELKEYRLTAQDILLKKHLADDCPAASLSEFKNLEFIILSEGNNLYDRSTALFEQAGFTPKIKMQISQLVTAYHLANHAMAATFISDRLITAPNDRLYYYRLDSELADRLFYLLLPDRNYTPLAVKAFIRHFTEAIA